MVFYPQCHGPYHTGYFIYRWACGSASCYHIGRFCWQGEAHHFGSTYLGGYVGEQRIRYVGYGFNDVLVRCGLLCLLCYYSIYRYLQEG